MGWAGQNGTYSSEVAPTNDMLSVTSLMRWGNYDAVNAAVRWNSLEVPGNLTDTTGSPSRYANPVPANQTLPNSFLSLATILVGHTLWHTALACRWPGCDWRKHSRCRRSREQYSGGTLLCEHSHRSCVSAFLCRQRSNLVLRRGNTQWPRWAQSPRGKLRSLASTLPVTMALFRITSSTGASVSYALASNPVCRLGWFRPLSQYPALQWLLDRKFELGTSAPTAARTLLQL